MVLFKVLVCGGRRFFDSALIRETLAAIALEHANEATVVFINGDAPGADSVAASEARKLGYHSVDVQALWGRFGASAGPIRNRVMLALEPDLVVAFPGNRGTADMVKAARAVGVQVREIP